MPTLTAMADANGSAWCRGVAAPSRALVERRTGDVYLEAIDTLTGAGVDVDLARAELLYGEWLRRRKRRRDARTHLRRAEPAGAGRGGLFAQRARSELEATGERVAPSVGRDFDLTSQEATVARLAAEGRTNTEIGSSLFISVNTVDYHLRKVFQKLGISSRRQLFDRLGGDGYGLTQTTSCTWSAAAFRRQARITTSRGGTMPFITTDDGAQIFYKDWGSTGTPVLLSHGWPLNADAWEAAALFLAEHGHRVIAHDRRGHGRSSQTWHGNEMDTYADDLATLDRHARPA